MTKPELSKVDLQKIISGLKESLSNLEDQSIKNFKRANKRELGLLRTIEGLSTLLIKQS